MTTTNNNSSLAVIDDSKKQLTEALTNITPDDFLISGLLNFVRSKFLSLIIKDINDSIRKASPDLTESELQLAQGDSKEAGKTAESLIDMIWSDFYHPVMKFYQSQFQDLKKQELKLNKKRTVELRKLNDKFRKISKLTSDFYLDLLKHILTQHKIDYIIPNTFYQLLNLELAPNSVKVNKSDNTTIVKLVYVVHRSLLFLGTISRYRSSFSQVLPKTEHEDFNRALQYCHYSELLLPAFGEARNHIGMIYNAQGDSLSAVYEFLRSALARIPSTPGASNYKACLNNTTQVIDDLNRLRLENNITNKNRYKYLSTYFIVLCGFHFNPSRWKRSENAFVNGTPVKDVRNDFYEIMSYLVSKGQDDVFIFQKLFILLIGGIDISEVSKTTSLTTELTNLFKFTFEFIDFVEKKFIELWGVSTSKGLKLLPFFRLVLSWLRVNKLALQYAHRDPNFLKTTAILLNLLFAYSSNGDFNHRPKRDQYFLEDVGLKEFTPIDRLFWDFDDSAIFEDNDSTLRLIGGFKEHDSEEETNLRVLSVGYLGKKIISANRVGIKYDTEKNLFDVENVQNIKKKKTPGAKLKPAPVKKETEQKIETPSAKRNRRRRHNGKQSQEKSAPAISSSASESSDGIVEISQNSFERRNDQDVLKDGIESLSVSNNSRVSQQPGSSQQGVLSIEELENKLTNAKKDQNYANMVDSLVDDTFSSNAASSNAPTNSYENTSWQPTPQYNIQPSQQQQQQHQQQQQQNFGQFNSFSPGFNNNNYDAFNSSPFLNQSQFPPYQSYFSAPYQILDHVQPPQPQPYPTANLFRQYNQLYGKQHLNLTPQPQQAELHSSMYSGYAGYPQYAYPPNIQVPQTPSQPQQHQEQPNGHPSTEHHS